jgi:hypothetical protein
VSSGTETDEGEVNTGGVLPKVSEPLTESLPHAAASATIDTRHDMRSNRRSMAVDSRTGPVEHAARCLSGG